MTPSPPPAPEARWSRPARVAILIIAAFYAYGAMVHVLNMASLTGFSWPAAPLKWQVLDIAYLILDLTVAAGLAMRWRIGAIAFFAAALSQIVLYTVLRPWILDVPEPFQRGGDDLIYLDRLVAFHGVTLLVMAASLRATARHDRGARRVGR